MVIKRMKKVDGEMAQLSRVLAGLAENPSSDLCSTSDGSQSPVTLALGDLTPPSGLHGYPHTTCVCTHIHINKKKTKIQLRKKEDLFVSQHGENIIPGIIF